MPPTPTPIRPTESDVITPTAASLPGSGPAPRRLSTLAATWRLARATRVVLLILGSYLLQRFLARVLGPRRAAARWDRVHAANARRLYHACVSLRGVYIKLGQVLSVMGTFLPPAYIRALEGLQDQVPPHPFGDVDLAVRSALGASPHVLFARFDERPLAAASLGQVHRAVTHDGETVAVKVLYPDIETLMALDLRVLAWGVALARRLFPVAQLERVHQQLSEMLARETDLRHEARCLVRMGACFAADPTVHVPVPYPHLSAQRVLTMSFMEGTKISERAALDRLGLEPQAVARKLVEVFFKNLLFDGYFHADPHPGNFFVRRGPAGEVHLVMLDLGSATPVEPTLVDGLMTLLGGFMAKDDTMVMRGVEAMGFVAPDGDRALLERTVRHYFERLLNLDITDFGHIGFEAAADLADPGLRRRELRALMRSIAYPEGWFYLERAAVILFGLSGQLAPQLNLAQVGFPFVARYVATHRVSRA